MSDHYYSSTNKHTYSDDPTYLRTAQKSSYKYEPESYFERTPEKMQAYSAKKGTRLSDAKKSIGQCIHMVSQKKKMNQEAFGEVKNINQQILGFYSSINPVKTNLLSPRNKTAQQYRRDDSRDVTVSQFQFKPFKSPKRIYQEEVRKFPTYQDPQAGQENIDLKSKLYNEMKRNNDLLKHISNLQAEVASLKSSKNPAVQIQEVLQQCRYLRNQLANTQAGSNYNLIQQLQKLKAENSELRRDTIVLLKSRPY